MSDRPLSERIIDGAIVKMSAPYPPEVTSDTEFVITEAQRQEIATLEQERDRLQAVLIKHGIDMKIVDAVRAALEGGKGEN